LIKYNKKESSQRLMCFSIDHPFILIKTNGESTEHYETIGSDAYKFKENLNHNWKLIKQDTIISGYVCKKATVNYAGRDWSAWYNLDIPQLVPINFMDYLDW
jgi:GLPGLI family protein